MIELQIDGTLTHAQAEQRCWDVIVIGAGPAGTVLAHSLARRGIISLLIDRGQPPRAKVCGGCVSAAGLSRLHSLGMSNVLDDLPHSPFFEVAFRQGAQCAVVPVPAGIAVTRSTLDAALLRAAIAQGVAFLPQTTGCLMRLGAAIDYKSQLCGAGQEYREVSVIHGNQRRVISGRVVIVAAGLSGTAVRGTDELSVSISARARIGFGGTYELGRGFERQPIPGRLEMTIDDMGYVGMIPVEQGKVNIAGTVERRMLSGLAGPAGCVQQILRGVADLDDVAVPLASVQWQVTGPLTRRCLHPAGHRVLALGDAAGYEEPFTGEGITWAIELATMAARLVERGVSQWTPALAKEWQTLVQHHHRRRRWACRWLVQLVRSRWGVQFSLAALQMFPWAGSMLARQIAGSRIKSCPTIDWNSR